MIFWVMPLMLTEEFAWEYVRRRLKDSGPTLAEDARVGALRVRQEILQMGAHSRFRPQFASG